MLGLYTLTLGPTSTSKLWPRKNHVTFQTAEQVNVLERPYCLFVLS